MTIDLLGIALKDPNPSATPKRLTVEAIMNALRDLPPPVPVAMMSQAMKDSLDANAGAEAPLTHIRCGKEGELREIQINNLIPDGVVYTTGGSQ